MHIDSLAVHINKIGNEIIKCNRKCTGICNNSSAGILPRGLILETDRQMDNIGYAVVGINPGPATEEEKKYYQKNGRDYSFSKLIWENRNNHKDGIKNFKYYKLIRKFTSELGMKGSILWTDLIKCQSINKREIPPIQTKRICSGLFLTREISALPASWPIIAIGKDSYIALSFLNLDRTIVGIPNPTARGNQFNKIFSDGRINDLIKENLLEVLKSPDRNAVWVNVNQKRIE